MNPGTISLAACAAFAALAPQQTDGLQERSLFSFADASSIDPWRSNHDRVMGGVSTGRPAWTGTCARFSGELSLENNGGFASFRVQMEQALDLTAYDGLRLRVRGDGRNWIVSLRTGQGRGDHNWQAPFQTRQSAEEGAEGDATWQDVMVPFDAFVPVYHGRYARTDGPLDRAKIVNFGLQVADGQAGDYALDVTSIGAWAASAADHEPGTLGARERRSDALGKTLDETPTAEALVDALKWSERVLVVAEPLVRDDYGKSASIQRGRFIAALGEVAARDLRIVHLLGNRAAIAAGRQLDPKATQALREHWSLPTGQWSCALVGKDGGVKQRWQKPFAVEEVFEIIDVMPMRRSEERKRSAPSGGER